MGQKLYDVVDALAVFTINSSFSEMREPQAERDLHSTTAGIDLRLETGFVALKPYWPVCLGSPRVCQCEEDEGGGGGRGKAPFKREGDLYWLWGDRRGEYRKLRQGGEKCKKEMGGKRIKGKLIIQAEARGCVMNIEYI